MAGLAGSRLLRVVMAVAALVTAEYHPLTEPGGPLVAVRAFYIRVAAVSCKGRVALRALHVSMGAVGKSAGHRRGDGEADEVGADACGIVRRYGLLLLLVHIGCVGKLWGHIVTATLCQDDEKTRGNQSRCDACSHCSQKHPSPSPMPVWIRPWIPGGTPAPHSSMFAAGAIC